jgi:3-methyl-2-oxobutanoate hydroxymethyltransferase
MKTGGNMKNSEKITARRLRAKKENNEKIVALTAYDAVTARLAAECGVDIILVGDSLGMTALGYSSTIPVTLEQSLHHCAAVRRGAPGAFVVGDMPFMTCRVSDEDSLRNAARYLQEAGADAVKLEGGAELNPLIEKMTAAGIPVMGHIGLLPQKLLVAGGYRVTGKTDAEAKRLIADAKAIEAAGAFAMVLECMPAALAGDITAQISIPTIGIGAGPLCSGQVQVVNDILGLFEEFTPKHTKKYDNLAERIRNVFKAYSADVRGGKFPGKEQSF